MSLKLGVHVSIGGGIHNSVTNAVNMGCTSFQIFSRNPRQWNAKVIEKKEACLFTEGLRQSSIDKIEMI